MIKIQKIFSKVRIMHVYGVNLAEKNDLGIILEFWEYFTGF